MQNLFEMIGVRLRQFTVDSLRRKIFLATALIALVTLSAVLLTYFLHFAGIGDSEQMADTITIGPGSPGSAALADSCGEITKETETLPGTVPVSPSEVDRPLQPQEQTVSRRTTPPVPAGKIAYRFEGGVWVASEDGSDAVRVISAGNGPVALSPDGAFIAVVHDGSISLVNLSTGSATKAGPARAAYPVWLKDSSAVLYESAAADLTNSEVWKLPVSGGGAQKVIDGHSPAVASDGTIVAIPALDPEIPEVEQAYFWVLRPGSTPLRSPAEARINAIAVMPGRVIYATGGGSLAGAGPVIWAAEIDGRNARQVMQGTRGDRPFGYSGLRLSPAGSHALATISGDDGYSRTQIIELETGRVTHLTVRRDTYPVGWTADGREVRFFEGNVFQGEESSLMGARKDGTGRRVIVQGAR